MVGLQSLTSTEDGRTETIFQIACQWPQRSPSPLSRRSQAKADGGEGWGEGELNCSSGHEPALTDILVSGFRVLNSVPVSTPNLVQVIEGHPRLPKHFFKKLFPSPHRVHRSFGEDVSPFLRDEDESSLVKAGKALFGKNIFPFAVTFAYESIHPKIH
jgi:hypothetical protein